LVSADALGPALDVVESLAQRRPVYSPGWIMQNRGATVFISMAERLEPGVASELARALDAQDLRLVMFDESLPDEPGVAGALFDRASLVLDQTCLIQDQQTPSSWLESQRQLTSDWRRHLAGPTRCSLSEDQMRRVAALSLALGIQSLRPMLVVSRLAVDLARSQSPKRRTVDDTSLDQAIVAALLPHARHWPQQTPEESSEPAQSTESDPPADDTPEPEPQPDPPSGSAPPQTTDDQTPAQPTEQDEQVIEAALVDLQRGLLAAAIQRARRLPPGQLTRREGGRAGLKAWHISRGRRVRVRSWVRGQSLRQLAWVKTLERALPLRGLRRVGPSPAEGAGKVLAPSEESKPSATLVLMPSDLRVWQRQHRRPLTTIFLVDASGSMAATRLAEAKGAAQALLAECYVRRDQVALLSFGGQGVRINLPPTRSLVAAKRALMALPGGGASPVAAGLQAVMRLLERLARDGEDAALVVLSDGRANLCLDGTVDRALATSQAHQAARALIDRTSKSLWIDTSPRPEQAARALAQAMSAAYYPLPFASASQIHALVSSAMQAPTVAGSVS
jgi:magnesium chelatase subunit D